MQLKTLGLLACSSFFLLTGIVHAALPTRGEEFEFPYGAPQVSSTTDGEEELLGKTLAEMGATDEKSLLNGLLDIFGLGQNTKYDGQIPKAIIYIKSTVNLLLGLLSLISLVIVIYSFYQMFFTEDSKGIEQVKKNLTGVAIALVIVGLSRIIVSFIFEIYKSQLLNPTS